MLKEPSFTLTTHPHAVLPCTISVIHGARVFTTPFLRCLYVLAAYYMSLVITCRDSLSHVLAAYYMSLVITCHDSLLHVFTDIV